MGGEAAAGIGAEAEGDDVRALDEPDLATGLLMFGIGNQWNWRHVTVGVDWIGLSVPVYTRVYRQADDGDSRTVALAPNGFRDTGVEALKLFVGIAL